jgi:membrane fusion protein (multidrug efflux system)
MQADLKALQADHDRYSQLLELGLGPREQAERARFKVESEEWDIRRVNELLANSKEVEHGLELELEKAQIRAPFAGIVARRYVHEGESVVKGGHLFWFTSEEPLRMRFTVPEKYLNRVRLGQKLILTSPNFPQESHAARVIEMSPVVDPASGTVEAMVELVGSKGNLRSGMTANLVIGKAK